MKLNLGTPFLSNDKSNYKVLYGIIDFFFTPQIAFMMYSVSLNQECSSSISVT